MQFCKSLVQKQKYTAENIGIITPYQRQVIHLKELLAKQYVLSRRLLRWSFK